MTTIERNGGMGPQGVMSGTEIMGGAKAERLSAGDIGVGAPRASWMALGKCRDMDPALFFPSDGVGVQDAQRICVICPMKIPCLEYALDNRIDNGVWGGMSERERRRIQFTKPNGRDRRSPVAPA
jgi:WhiB family redox-sensing transcriptional regulator